jgi:hypothetical protein
MGYRSGADGITHKGKTKGRNLGDSGPNDKIEMGKKSSTGGINQDKMEAVGRGLAKVAANGK